MKRIKYLGLFLLCSFIVLSCNNLYSQQDPLFSQYMFSGIYLNPAIAGTSNNIETVAMYRQQWSNVVANPSTLLLNMNMPIDHNRMGLGGQLLKSSFGDMQFIHFNFSGSYKINVGKGKLSMGLEAGGRYYRFSYDNLIVKDITDKVLVNSSSKLIPDFGAGLYYYSKQKFIGISCKHINHGTVAFTDKNAFDFKLAPHYYLNAGFEMRISKHNLLKPMCLIKYVNKAPLQADLSLLAYFHSIFWAGVTVRTSKEAGVLLGVIPNKIISSIGGQCRIGFAFDYGFNNASVNSQAGSYEIVLNYIFKPRPNPNTIKKKSTITSPMLFGNSPE